MGSDSVLHRNTREKKHYQTFVVSSYDHSKTNKKCRNICCNRTKVELNCYLSRLLWLKYNQKFAPAPETILIKVLREFGLRILEPNCKLSKPPWLNQIQRVETKLENKTWKLFVIFIHEFSLKYWINFSYAFQLVSCVAFENCPLKRWIFFSEKTSWQAIGLKGIVFFKQNI